MTKSFADLGVSPELVSVLARQGVHEPFPIQTLTLPDALSGRHVCGKANTGSGKTLAFALPLVQRTTRARSGAPRALVLVPTRELATQVVDVLRPLAQALDLRLLAVYGGASFDKQSKAARRGVDIVVATPGRLTDLVERRVLSLDGVDLAVIDEADRMADMGFLRPVEWILGRFGHRQPQLLLFSATLDGQVDSLVRAHMRDPARHEDLSEAVTVRQMAHRFLGVHRTDRVRVAAAVCRGAFRTLVFVRTKRGADRLARQLQQEGIQAGAIHGDLRQSARERALDRFASGKLQALVATDVASRGIHVEDVDVVIHFDVPDDHKIYLHRSGRTARAGRSGTVATLVLSDQVPAVRRLQKRLGLSEPVLGVVANDPRLGRLTAMEPPMTAAS